MITLTISNIYSTSIKMIPTCFELHATQEDTNANFYETTVCKYSTFLQDANELIRFILIMK